SISAVRKDEYVSLALLHKYWDDDDVQRYEQLMKDIRVVDATIHELNAEATLVAAGKKPTADPAITKPITDRLKPLVQRLMRLVTEFLTNLL
ncbi:MAG TPA: hypothetical protein VLK84_26945, partial [Longimicrobium sp.]|nr:hypothetical protein [Longimicrobium sp.]